MSSQQQYRPLGVVLCSHLQSALAAAYLALCAVRPKLAQAISAQRNARSTAREGAPAGASSPAAAVPRPGRSAAALGVAYLLTPVLAFVTWRALSQVLPGAVAAGVGGSLLLFVPPLVHVAHGAIRRALRALASLLGHVVVGSAAGAALGRMLANLSCDPELGECGLTVLAWLLLGAIAGGVSGYCVHAVRQVFLAIESPSAPHVEAKV